jgi:hypothetical protein
MARDADSECVSSHFFLGEARGGKMAAFFSSLHQLIIELILTVSLLIGGYKILRDHWLSGSRPKGARKKVRRDKRVSGTQPVRIFRQNRH